MSFKIVIKLIYKKNITLIMNINWNKKSLLNIIVQLIVKNNKTNDLN